MRIILLADNVSMNMGHLGLANIAKVKFRTDVEKLGEGDLIMFLNAKHDKLKVLGRKGIVLGYIRMPHGRRMMVEAIQYLPQTFGGGQFNYDAALAKALNDRLAVRYQAKAGPLQVYRAAKVAGLLK